MEMTKKLERFFFLGFTGKQINSVVVQLHKNMLQNFKHCCFFSAIFYITCFLYFFIFTSVRLEFPWFLFFALICFCFLLAVNKFAKKNDYNRRDSIFTTFLIHIYMLFKGGIFVIIYCFIPQFMGEIDPGSMLLIYVIDVIYTNIMLSGAPYEHILPLLINASLIFIPITTDKTLSVKLAFIGAIAVVVTTIMGCNEITKLRINFCFYKRSLRSTRNQWADKNLLDQETGFKKRRIFVSSLNNFIDSNKDKNKAFALYSINNYKSWSEMKNHEILKDTMQKTGTELSAFVKEINGDIFRFSDDSFLLFYTAETSEKAQENAQVFLEKMQALLETKVTCAMHYIRRNKDITWDLTEDKLIESIKLARQSGRTTIEFTVSL